MVGSPLRCCCCPGVPEVRFSYNLSYPGSPEPGYFYAAHGQSGNLPTLHKSPELPFPFFFTIRPAYVIITENHQGGHYGDPPKEAKSHPPL